MKINEVEQILGITKANIRFYEKEGLLSPSRTESGYRDYSDSDIARLKTIVIYRKLGIPVQQIADILDGAVSLQDALDANIKSLNAEIEKLNGSLALCKQLKAEDADTLDAERYWDIVQNQELHGFQFQSLASDYINFIAPTLSWLYWTPEDVWHSPARILKYILGWSILFALLNKFLLGVSFGEQLGIQFFGKLGGLLVWCVLLLPVYLIGRKNPKFADWISKFLIIALPIIALAIVCYCFCLPFLA